MVFVTSAGDAVATGDQPVDESVVFEHAELRRDLFLTLLEPQRRSLTTMPVVLLLSNQPTDENPSFECLSCPAMSQFLDAVGPSAGET